MKQTTRLRYQRIEALIDLNDRVLERRRDLSGSSLLAFYFGLRGVQLGVLNVEQVQDVVLAGDILQGHIVCLDLIVQQNCVVASLVNETFAQRSHVGLGNVAIQGQVLCRLLGLIKCFHHTFHICVLNALKRRCSQGRASNVSKVDCTSTDSIKSYIGQRDRVAQGRARLTC